MCSECHQKSYQQIHQDESHDNQEKNENKPCHSRNVLAAVAIENIVKIKLSDHHNSCFHDRTGWILKRRLEKKNRSTGDYFAKAMTCCFVVLELYCMI